MCHPLLRGIRPLLPAWKHGCCWMVLWAVSATGFARAVPPGNGDFSTDTIVPVHEKIIPAAGRSSQRWLVAGAHAAFLAGSWYVLDQAWYADYPKGRFHFFNDNREWNQMDKAGHAWTSYQLGRISSRLWVLGGLNQQQSTWLGGLSGLAYQGIVELQDGYSKEWGFSWGDMAANGLGTTLFIAQELGWKEQRLQLKLGFSSYRYADATLQARKEELFGNTGFERLLKDYNAQNYWVSVNLHSFMPESRWPRWLNIAAGYSAGGMLGGLNNTWTDKDGLPADWSEIPRTRHYLLSPDIDFTKIPARSKLVRSVFFILNMVKVPAPTLELNSRGHFRAHLLYF